MPLRPGGGGSQQPAPRTRSLHAVPLRATSIAGSEACRACTVGRRACPAHPPRAIDVVVHGENVQPVDNARETRFHSNYHWFRNFRRKR